MLAGAPQPTAPERAVTMLVLRHGQSEWNAARRWQGTADSPLTDLGRAQARDIARRLASTGERFAGPWASDLRRATETAAILAGELAIGPVRGDVRLREAFAGEWEGRTPDEIEERWPGWLASHRRPPSFEAFEHVVARALAALRSIAAGAGGGSPPLVVAHSGLIRSVVRHLGETDARIPNLGGVWLTVDGSAAAARSATSGLADPLDASGIRLDDVFDPAGIVLSGVDAPGEDPGDQADDAQAHRRAER